MAQPESFFQRLTRLFRSGPSIQRRIKGYDYKNYYNNQMIQGNYGYRAPAPMGFGRENSPFSSMGAQGILDRMARYSEFAEMEYCLIGSTKIATPDGYKTIQELADTYGLDKTFIVYSYDHAQGKIVPSVGKQARKTRHDHAWKVTFDSGHEIIGTANHRLMKRDGSYVEIQDLHPNDSMMPFYRRDFYNEERSDTGTGYRWIYDSKKFVLEHKLIAEWTAGRSLTEDEVVHHINYIKNDNRPENLKIMSRGEHTTLHNNEQKWSEENSEWIEKFKEQHSAWMKQNNPAERQDVTFEKILYWCDTHSFNLYKVAKAFDTDHNTIKRKLRTKGFENWISFAKTYSKDWKSESWDNVGDKNPRYNTSVTFEKICNFYQKGTSQKKLAQELGVSITPLNNRLREAGYDSWSSFTENYQNHKVVKVEYYGKIDLYDLTVDGYKNFATDSVISHNTPEIATALDIYADETVGGDDRGKAFHVYSKNPEIKKTLDELFYDILNVEFNLRPWARNLVKFGDFFLFNEVVPDIGVINAVPIPVNELEREEGFDEQDPYAVRFKWITRGNQYLENWQVTHLRILGNDLFLPYGSSVLEPGRRIWRQLIMMEDSMLVYRIVRSPERRVFYIDVGAIAPNDIPAYMEAAKATLRSNTIVDKQTGRTDMRYNPLPIHKDTPIPLLDGRILSIETLAEEYANGKENWVYSIQDETLETVPGKVTWCGKNYTANKLVKVWLDDETYITTAPEHPFVLHDGSSLRADQLTTGLSLMPLYKELSTSSFLSGYERVWDNAKQKYIYTHRIVAEEIFKKERNDLLTHENYMLENRYLVVHHKDFNKNNNSPSNLKWIGNKAHSKMHGDLGRKNIIKYNQSSIKRKRTSELNIEKNSIDAMTWYNGSDLHKLHNDIRKEAQKKSWSKDKDFRSKAMRWIISDEFIENLAIIVRDNPKFGRSKIHNLVLENSSMMKNLKSVQIINREIEKFSFAAWEGELVRRGYEKLSGFRNSVVQGYRNHKVARIEILENVSEDVYCMTVVGPNEEDDRHNFAVHSFDQKGNISKSAVSLKNSVDEDYFIPVRGTQAGTRVETLAGGTNATAVEDVEYIQKKLFAALKVPKPYLNYDEQVGAKATLAQEDVRFSRTIGSIQKIFIAELNKLAMIHLYARGFDGEDLINFELKLSNPSTIAIQQRLELWATKFDIGASAKETMLVDENWIQKNILELTDEDIISIGEGRREDKINEVELEAVEAQELVDQQNKTIDQFDPNNYEMGGEAVEKTPPPSDDESAENILNRIKSYDEEGNPYHIDYKDGESPLKANPRARSKHNRRRRVKGRGADNLASPDFAAMLHPGKNRSLKDLYDKRFLDNPLGEEIQIHRTPMIPSDVKSLMRRFDEAHPRKTGLINEVDLKLDDDKIVLENLTLTEDDAKDVEEILDESEIYDESLKTSNE